MPTPRTECLAVCDALIAAGITPIHGTIDLACSFTPLEEQRADVGASSPVSFEKDFSAPVEQLLQVAAHSNATTARRGHGDDDPAFSSSDAAPGSVGIQRDRDDRARPVDRRESEWGTLHFARPNG